MEQIKAFNTQLVKKFDEVNNCFTVRFKLTGEPPAAIGFNDIGSELNKLVKNVTGRDLASLVPAIELLKGNKEIGETIKIYLIELYLKAEKKDPISTDYALWVGLVDTGELEKKLPLTVHRFYLKVWKTGDEKVLEEMKVSGLQDLIAGSI